MGIVKLWSLVTCGNYHSAPTTLSAATTVQSEFPDHSKAPSFYLDLKEVFSKAWATSLSPHHEYDCASDLYHWSLLTPFAHPHLLQEQASVFWARKTRLFNHVLMIEIFTILPLKTGIQHLWSLQRLNSCRSPSSSWNWIYGMLIIWSGKQWMEGGF